MTALPHSTPLTGAISRAGVGYEAYRLLQIGFIVLPIIVGLDKFFNIMVDWSMYLAPWVDRLMGGHSRETMVLVGIVEMAAGVGIALKPKYFGYVVAAWLAMIIINLLSLRMFYDIAMRDFGLFLAALALARLSLMYDHGMWGGLYRRST